MADDHPPMSPAPPGMSPAPRERPSVAFTPPPAPFTPREYSHARGQVISLEDENARLQKQLRDMVEDLKLRDSELSKCRVELLSLSQRVASAREAVNFSDKQLKKGEEMAEQDQKRLLQDRNALRERIAEVERDRGKLRAQLREEQQRRRDEGGIVQTETRSQPSAAQESTQEAKRRRIDEPCDAAEGEQTLSPQERVLGERDAEILEVQQDNRQLRVELATAQSSALEKEKQRAKEQEDAERSEAQLKLEILKLRSLLYEFRPHVHPDDDERGEGEPEGKPSGISYDEAREAIEERNRFRMQVPALIEDNRQLRHRIAMRQLRSHATQEAEEGGEVGELRRQLEEAEEEARRYKSERDRAVHEPTQEEVRPTDGGASMHVARDGDENEEAGSRRDKLEVKSLRNRLEKLQDQMNAELAKSRRQQQEIEQAGLQRDFALEARNHYKSQEAELRSELKETRKERLSSEHQLRVCQTRLKVYEQAWERCATAPAAREEYRPPAPTSAGSLGVGEAMAAILERVARAGGQAKGEVGDTEEWTRQRTELRTLRKEAARFEAEAKEHEAARASAEAAQAKTQEQLSDARKALQAAEEKLKADAAKHAEERAAATTTTTIQTPSEQVPAAVLDQMRKELEDAARTKQETEKGVEDLRNSIQEQEAVLQQLQHELSEKKVEAASAKRQLDSEEQKREEWEKERETQLDQLGNREKEVQRREQALQSEIGLKEEQVKEKEAERIAALAQAEEASAEVGQLKEELNRVGKKMKEKDVAVQGHVAEVEELQARVKELEQGRTQGMIDEILHRGGGQLPDEIAVGLRERDQELQQLRQIVAQRPVSEELQASEMGVYNDCLQARLDRAERQLQCELGKRLELETRCTELSAANRDVSTLQQEKERNARELYDRERTVAELRAQLAQVEKDRDVLTRENEQAKSEIEAVTSRHREELARGKALRGELMSVREELVEAKGKAAEMENKTKVVEEQFEKLKQSAQSNLRVARRYKDGQAKAKEELEKVKEELEKAKGGLEDQAACLEKLAAAEEVAKQKTAECENIRKRAGAQSRNHQKKIKDLEEQFQKFQAEKAQSVHATPKETPGATTPATPPSAVVEARTSSPTQAGLRQRAGQVSVNPPPSVLAPAGTAKAGVPPILSGEVVVVDDDDAGEETVDQPAGGTAEQLPGGGSAAAQAAVQAVAAKRRRAGKGPSPELDAAGGS
eukprot:Hpha_TRINITY_DN16011_c4_g2::TRINITY_DN16011_c4_g2_i1::g.119632::m.119632